MLAHRSIVADLASYKNVLAMMGREGAALGILAAWLAVLEAEGEG